MPGSSKTLLETLGGVEWHWKASGDPWVSQGGLGGPGRLGGFGKPQNPAQKAPEARIQSRKRKNPTLETRIQPRKPKFNAGGSQEIKLQFKRPREVRIQLMRPQEARIQPRRLQEARIEPTGLRNLEPSAQGR